MSAPDTIRFRLLKDAKGQDRLAFSPSLIPGMLGMVRCVLHPKDSTGSSSSLRPGIETIDLPWEEYKKAPSIIYGLFFQDDPTGGR